MYTGLCRRTGYQGVTGVDALVSARRAQKVNEVVGEGRCDTVHPKKDPS